MMRRAAMLGLFILGSCAIASSASAAEFPLEMKKMTLEEATSCPVSGLESRLNTQKPEAIRNEPKAISDRPLYGLLRCNEETTIAVRLDESQGKGKGYDRLIMDLNRNGNLADDPVYKGSRDPRTKRWESGNRVVFGPIEVAIGKEQGPANISLHAELTYSYGGTRFRRGSPEGDLFVQAGCYLETTVDLGGVKQKIGIVDSNFNMRFGDTDEQRLEKSRDGSRRYWIPQRRGDGILRDYDGSGKFQPYLYQTEIDPIARVIYFGANPYTMSLAKDLKKIRFEPYSGPAGELSVKNGDKICLLDLQWESSPGKWEYLAPDVTSGKVKVPVGTVCLQSCTLTAKDSKSATIYGSGRNSSTQGATVKIEEGKTAALECGPPLDLQVRAEKFPNPLGLWGSIFSRQSWSLGVSVSLVGSGGEIYGAFRKGEDQEANPPGLRILDEKGKVVASGQMEYG